jgi:L-ascorbate metabolism protein UlaG (beta-lactamase superfamily)
MSFLTLSALKDKIHKIVTPLGLSSTLEYWGFDNKIITEVDWQESVKIDEGLNITSVPSRHFSGRFLKRNQTVWTAYVLDWNKYKIFIGGDSGYDNQFKIIGEKYGPFDIKTKILFPVHWSKFVLSIHAWNEPIKLLRKAAALMDYK